MDQKIPVFRIDGEGFRGGIVAFAFVFRHEFAGEGDRRGAFLIPVVNDVALIARYVDGDRGAVFGIRGRDARQVLDETGQPDFEIRIERPAEVGEYVIRADVFPVIGVAQIDGELVRRDLRQAVLSVVGEREVDRRRAVHSVVGREHAVIVECQVVDERVVQMVAENGYRFHVALEIHPRARASVPDNGRFGNRGLAGILGNGDRYVVDSLGLDDDRGVLRVGRRIALCFDRDRAVGRAFRVFEGQPARLGRCFPADVLGLDIDRLGGVGSRRESQGSRSGAQRAYRRFIVVVARDGAQSQQAGACEIEQFFHRKCYLR